MICYWPGQYTSAQSLVTNPLSVAGHPGKLRLVLDCHSINAHLKTPKVTIEGAEVLVKFIKRGGYLRAPSYESDANNDRYRSHLGSSSTVDRASHRRGVVLDGQLICQQRHVAGKGSRQWLRVVFGCQRGGGRGNHFARPAEGQGGGELHVHARGNIRQQHLSGTAGRCAWHRPDECSFNASTEGAQPILGGPGACPPEIF